MGNKKRLTILVTIDSIKKNHRPDILPTPTDISILLWRCIVDRANMNVQYSVNRKFPWIFEMTYYKPLTSEQYESIEIAIKTALNNYGIIGSFKSSAGKNWPIHETLLKGYTEDMSLW